MSTERPWDPPAHPSSEASDEALAVLLAMAGWKQPIKHAELVALTGLDSRPVSLALRGLQNRGRAVVEGRGPHATWQLAHRQQGATQAQQQGSAS